MKHRRKPKNEMKVTVTFSKANKQTTRRHHGEIPSADVAAIRKKAGLSQSTFADSIGALISFIEGHAMIRASELAKKFLGITVPVKATEAAPVPVPAATEGAQGAEATPVTTPAESTLTVEERAKIVRLQGDLMWLVREGYVTEFIDGRLFAPPPVVEARKKEVEVEEHDPENFPEVPVSAPEPAPVRAAVVEIAPVRAAVVETAPVAEASVAVSVGPDASVAVAPVAEEPKPVEPSA